MASERRPPIAELHRLDSIAHHQGTSTPFVLRGGAAGWPAKSRWAGQEGADYLSARHGDTLVDVAVSQGGTFSGDVRKAASTSMLFRDFLNEKAPTGSAGAEDQQGCGTPTAQGAGDTSGREGTASGDAGHPDGLPGPEEYRLYLAQCPMLCAADGDDPLLPELMADIKIPSCLGQQRLCSVNLWMCRSYGTKSTLHYDGHHNLLCLVSGEKELTLYPPDDAELLDSLPAVHMPSCNHCSVEGGDGFQVVVRAGDCLFIPEGWFHKVSSKPFTVAVNLWWPGMGSWLAATETSMATSCCCKVSASCTLPTSEVPSQGWCAGVSKAYLCRRLLEGLMDEYGHQMRTAGVQGDGGKKRKRSVSPKKDAAVFQSSGAGTRQAVESGEETHSSSFSEGGSEPLQEMPQAAGRTALSACRALKDTADVQEQCETLRRMRADERDAALLGLGLEGDGRLAGLVRGMDALTAEILTRGWESVGSERQEQQQAFYHRLWACFPDGGGGAMSQLLEKKEAFSRSVVEGVLRRALGFECGS